MQEEAAVKIRELEAALQQAHNDAGKEKVKNSYIRCSHLLIDAIGNEL